MGTRWTNVQRDGTTRGLIRRERAIQVGVFFSLFFFSFFLDFFDAHDFFLFLFLFFFFFFFFFYNTQATRWMEKEMEC